MSTVVGTHSISKTSGLYYEHNMNVSGDFKVMPNLVHHSRGVIYSRNMFIEPSITTVTIFIVQATVATIAN
jgi:hypothetical protein